ncbi:sigma-70 family RNA polymerase sigma factor [Prosthecomicrobium hirschii]|uniref:sigma-70 family RNA polymerase sigma factor n=1 Tax=Prosthecodimorpha hirschii TaxID=665126 RepID=UPI001FEDE580|nr:sigma-70 family RNA polymerase sigma factor [Prosthecomicrobium hirschii]MCW1840673.1 sigma-70 family RNA polymerase sigma factor [Prosthecomicrobium hirschii]
MDAGTDRDAEGVETEVLLAGCAAGDRSALARIYAAEAGRMLGVAERILKRRALAEEAVQDAFVQIWRRADSFDPRLGRGRSWIYAILRNRALNILRSEARTDLVEEPDDLERPSEGDDPETMVLKLSEASALRRCLERLDTRRRAALVLAYTEGLSHGELAGRLGMPLGTVKSWIRRSLSTLKECLG